MIQLKDQIGVIHSFKILPKRIVSLVPSQTELLYDMGLDEQIIGITKFCVHPKHFLKTKTIVGGTKNPNFDKIRALQPDIIICNKEENTKDIVAACSKIATVWVTDISTVEDNNRMIFDFGILFDIEKIATHLISKINKAAIDFRNSISEQPIGKAAYFIWKKPYMVAGNLTFIDQMLQLNHFENVYRNQNRYPEINFETITNLEIDLILLSSEPYPFKETDKEEFQKQLPNSKIIIVDGEMFSWHGSRMLKAFEYFKTLPTAI